MPLPRLLELIEADSTLMKPGEKPRQYEARCGIHAIMDNYATHKHPEVLAWLADNPRWTFHFTPTSCSWLNAVEGVFSKLTRQALRRGVFRSVEDLVATIERYIASTSDDPKPFIWTASAASIMAKLRVHQPNDSEQ